MQITLVEPGGFETEGVGNTIRSPQHPRYNKPTLPSVVTRKVMDRPENRLSGDVHKAVAKIYELTCLDNPPIRLPLGKDCVSAMKARIVALQAIVDQYESWSEDLTSK